MNGLISICIPAYKQPALLESCLQSILRQTYKHIEVIITDDSPDESVKIIVEKYAAQLNIRYYQNIPALGSPANWNAALMKAGGDYLLLLHHDDLLVKADSLDRFVTPILNNSTIDFVFGRHSTIEKISGGKAFKGIYFKKYYKNPALLITGNTIGPPSNVLLKRSILEAYNERLKWVVDIEYYTRLFIKKRRFYYVDEKLIEVGIHEAQVTNECLNNPPLLIFENVYYASLYLNSSSVDIRIYDFYWRLFRNLGIKSLQDIIRTGITSIPPFIQRIISTQQKVSTAILRKGFLSKPLMVLSYLKVL